MEIRALNQGNKGRAEALAKIGGQFRDLYSVGPLVLNPPGPDLYASFRESTKSLNCDEADSVADERPAAPSEPDLDGRKTAYAQYKRACKDAGVKMTEEKLAKLANRRWNTRDPIMKWKSGKDRPGDDERIRSAIGKGPPAA